MKHIKTYENVKELKEISKDDLNRLRIDSPYIEIVPNYQDTELVKVEDVAKNYYYHIRIYYRKPGYKTYCFLEGDRGLGGASRIWIDEDKILKPSEEEIDEYLAKVNQLKYNL